MNDGQRIGGWIQTHSGKRFYPLDPRVEEIDIEDIAHALSNICRFGGHSYHFYGVGQHCVFVSQLVEEYCQASNWSLEATRQASLAALLHDASEAYLLDLPTPIKHSVVGYSLHEDFVQAFINHKFSVDDQHHDIVKHCDEVALVTEMRDLMPPRDDAPKAPASSKRMQAMTPRQAKVAFLIRFSQLTD